MSPPLPSQGGFSPCVAPRWGMAYYFMPFSKKRSIMKDQQKKQRKNPDVHDPSQLPHKTPRKASIENPDTRETPDPAKRPNPDDDPDQTRKKIPVEEEPKQGS
jgi:hypothetical protein